MCNVIPYICNRINKHACFPVLLVEITWQLVIDYIYTLISSHVIKTNKQLGIRRTEWWNRIMEVTIDCATNKGHML